MKNSNQIIFTDNTITFSGIQTDNPRNVVVGCADSEPRLKDDSFRLPSELIQKTIGRIATILKLFMSAEFYTLCLEF